MGDEFYEYDVLENITYSLDEEADVGRLEAGTVVIIFALVAAFAGELVATVYVFKLVKCADTFQVTSMYMANMCIADLFSHFTGAMLSSSHLVAFRWVFGDAICKLTVAVVNICSFVSDAFLEIMTVDCYWASIMNERDSNAYRTRWFRYLTATVWSTAIVLAIPFLMIFGTMKHGISPRIHCVLLYHYEEITIPLMLAPIVLSIVCLLVSWIMLFLAYFPSGLSTLTVGNGSEGYAVRRTVLAVIVTLTVSRVPWLIPRVIGFLRVSFTVWLWKLDAFMVTLVFIGKAVICVVYLLMRRRLTASRDLNHPANSLLVDRQEMVRDGDL